MQCFVHRDVVCFERFAEHLVKSNPRPDVLGAGRHLTGLRSRQRVLAVNNVVNRRASESEFFLLFVEQNDVKA